MRLTRSLEGRENPTRQVGALFEASPGRWRVGGRAKSAIHSPDNSYNGSLSIAFFAADEGLLRRAEVHVQTKGEDWKAFSKTMDAPRGTVRAQLQASLNKTWGSVELDSLSASYLASAAESTVERVVISSEAVGNLFLPDDPLRFTIAVDARRPLAKPTLTCEVRDYKNTSQGSQPLSLKLIDWKTGHFRYEAKLEWPRAAIELGRFYRLHLAEPFEQYSGFARLPEAVTRKHPPGDVPFTIRNWDGRLEPYFYLADRIGIRQIGLWGGWKTKAPYNPQLPGIDIVEKLGMRWLTGSPGAHVERGNSDWSESGLRDGMREFCLLYKDRGLQMIALGNEPHGGEAQIRRNVAAYKTLYESAKSVDSAIQVLATSVEPNEGYFKAGYHRYCDAYDFHIYETPEHLQKQMRDYRALMEKYDAVKPIHSTELGLNSQGLSRERVAIDMVKKACVFFAEGGASMSWFTIMYPDPDGDQRGSFGQAHCVFDSAYNQYNPKLDAITYYHLVNGLCVKRFCELRNWGDVTAYRFADASDQQWVAMWSDSPKTISLHLPRVAEVRTTQIDGQHQQLKAQDSVFTLPLSASPVMLEYRQAAARLHETLR
ncbi:MAG: hypothetical protein ACI8W8_004179 [Rhodothermales bacterium]|jgi:hypothetical protein